MQQFGVVSTYQFHQDCLDFRQLLNMTLPPLWDYIYRHDYTSFVYEIPLGQEYTGFAKIHQLIEICEKVMYDLDWLFWIDTDALITNPKIRLEQFAHDDYDLIIGEDWNGINVGVFMFRVNPDTLRFLKQVVEFQPSEQDKQQYAEWWWVSEQHAIHALKNTIRTNVIHHSLFNGYLFDPIIGMNDWRGEVPGPTTGWDGHRRWQPGDFIIHAAGGDVDYKIRIFHKALNQL